MYFKGMNFTDFWNKSEYAINAYTSEYPDDQTIYALEQELGYTLPASYIWLMKQHNGGIPTRDCFPTSTPTSWAKNHITISGIMGIGYDKTYSIGGSLGSQFMIEEWGYPNIGIAICDCPSAGHDMVFLDYRSCGPQGEPCVVHIDQEGDYQITKLADTFEDFICGLVDSECFDDEEDGETQDVSLQETSDNELECNPDVYSREQMEIIEQFITTYFGEFPSVWHEIVSPDIHVDICIVPPNEKQDYYFAVTMGMGAYAMQVPEELRGKHLERAVLCIALPRDWQFDMEDETCYWPIRLLKGLARFPRECETWLGWGHTIDNQNEYADDTGFSGCMLIEPQNTPEEDCICKLDEDCHVNFYQIIPLYREEMIFKQENNADQLLDRMAEAEIDSVVDIDRYNVASEEEDYEQIYMDCALGHLESLQEKALPMDEINAYNHLAIYLRWGIENDLMSDVFKDYFYEEVTSIQQGKRVDLRYLLRDDDRLNHSLITPYFNEEGEAFAYDYYVKIDETERSFPNDIDAYALQYFGEEVYHSEEFQDEAYLFIPFDEAYYEGMKQVINQRFEDWKMKQKVRWMN